MGIIWRPQKHSSNFQNAAPGYETFYDALESYIDIYFYQVRQLIFCCHFIVSSRPSLTSVAESKEYNSQDHLMYYYKIEMSVLLNSSCIQSPFSIIVVKCSAFQETNKCWCDIVA